MSRNVGEITREDLDNESKRNKELKLLLENYTNALSKVFTVTGVRIAEKKEELK